MFATDRIRALALLLPPHWPHTWGLRYLYSLMLTRFGTTEACQSILFSSKSQITFATRGSNNRHWNWKQTAAKTGWFKFTMPNSLCFCPFYRFTPSCSEFSQFSPVSVSTELWGWIPLAIFHSVTILTWPEMKEVSFTQLGADYSQAEPELRLIGG